MTDRLRELEKAATPAPWRGTVQPDGRGGIWQVGSSLPVFVANFIDEEDAALIAETRNALPLLLDVVDAARQVRPVLLRLAWKNPDVTPADAEAIDAFRDALDAAQ